MKRNCKFLKMLQPFILEKYGPEKTEIIMEKARNRYEEIVRENIHEPKKMYMHTRERIYPGIASFDAMVSEGISRQDATELLIYYYRKSSEKMAVWVRRLAALPGMYKRIPALFEKLTHKMFGEDSGFRAIYYDTPKTEMKIDMTFCPYFEICKKYGCPEIVPAYCESDDVCYGNMHPGLVWGRTKTLGKGGDCCDFRIKVK